MQQLEARSGDRVTHRHTSPVTAMELEATHESGIRQALQATLRRRGRPAGIEPAVDLAAQHVTHARHEREDLQVQRLGLQRPWLLYLLGPAYVVRPIELHELAVAVRGYSGSGRACIRLLLDCRLPRPVRLRCGSLG